MLEQYALVQIQLKSLPAFVKRPILNFSRLRRQIFSTQSTLNDKA